MLLISFDRIAILKTMRMFFLLLLVSTTCVRAEDWKTTDGMFYQNVKVVRVEDDAVTIMYKDGGALVPLEKLPPPIQKQFDYDPNKAKVAAAARAKQDAV